MILKKFQKGQHSDRRRNSKKLNLVDPYNSNFGAWQNISSDSYDFDNEYVGGGGGSQSKPVNILVEFSNNLQQHNNRTLKDFSKTQDNSTGAVQKLGKFFKKNEDLT